VHFTAESVKNKFEFLFFKPVTYQFFLADLGMMYQSFLGLLLTKFDVTVNEAATAKNSTMTQKCSIGRFIA